MNINSNILQHLLSPALSWSICLSPASLLFRYFIPPKDVVSANTFCINLVGTPPFSLKFGGGVLKLHLF